RRRSRSPLQAHPPTRLPARPGASRAGAAPSGSSLPAVFRGDWLQRPPEVPRGDAAIGTPALPAAQDLLRIRQSAVAEGAGESLANAVVPGGQDVLAPQAEQQKHLDGPAADPANAGQPFDDLLIVHPPQGPKRGDSAVEGLLGQIPEGRDLGPR